MMLPYVLVSLSAAAQPASLKDFLAASDTQNLDRRVSLEMREKAVAEYQQAWTALLPSLTVQGAWTRNQKEVTLDVGGQLAPVLTDALTPVYTALAKLGQPVTPPAPASGAPAVITPLNQLDATIRVELPLVDTMRWMRVAAANDSRLGAAEKDAVTRDLVRRQVIAAYYGYAAALAMKASATKALGASEAQLKLTSVRASAGTVTELDVARAKAEVARNRQTVVDANFLALTTRRTLHTLSGVAPPEHVPMPPADLNAEPSFEELERAVEALPAVRAADHDADAAGSLSLMQKLAFVPTVGAQFTERITNATGFTGQSALYGAGVTATWRLDGPTIAGVGVQARGASVARIAAERARIAARDQLYSDAQRFGAALQKMSAVEAQVAAAAQAAKVARDRYAAGAATQIDVITADRDLSQAEFAQIQALTDLATARLALRLSAGRPLD